jgi:Tol biopolymer transport system component
VILSYGTDVGYDQALYRLSLGTRKLHPLPIPERGIDDVAIARRGHRLVFSLRPNEQDIWVVNAAGARKHPVSSTRRENNPQFSPDGTRIVFSSTRSGRSEIWTANSDGSGQLQLSNYPRSNGTPRWSPNGELIAYDNLGEDGQADIYVINSRGGTPRRITTEPSNEVIPSFSRDGQWIYFRSERTGRSEIYRVPVAGGRQEQLTQNGGDVPFASPDGTMVYYLKNRAGPLFRMPLAGGAEERLPINVHERSYHPTANTVYFLNQTGTAEHHEVSLHAYDLSRREDRELHRIKGALGLGLTVAPDEREFLLTILYTPGSDLMLIDNFP